MTSTINIDRSCRPINKEIQIQQKKLSLSIAHQTRHNGSVGSVVALVYNRVCKIIGTDILKLYEAILHLVSLTSIQILSLEVVFAYAF